MLRVIVIGLYTHLLYKFQCLIKAENEYLLPMKYQVLTFFIVSITVCSFKLVQGVIELTYSDKIHSKGRH